MSMHKQKTSGVKVGDLAVLAGSVGLVANDEQGREAFCAWWATDPKAARKALFSRVEARRVAAAKTPAYRAATAAEAQAGRSGEPTDYPAWMGRPKQGAAASVRAAVQVGPTLAVIAPKYPPSWLVAAGQAGRQGGVTVVEVND